MNPTASSTSAFTISGNTLTSHGMPDTSVTNGQFSVSYTARFIRRQTYAADGLIYTPQFSADLVTWQNSTATPTVVATDATHEAVSVPYPLFINGKKARFFRISVSTTP
jgi:hypothetical protein